MNYEFLKDICTQRESTRKFSDKGVSKEDIESIKAIAYTSPYASGRKNWDIVVVDDKVLIENLANLVKNHLIHIKDNIRTDYQEAYQNYSENFTFFNQAPVLLIPTFRISPTLTSMMEEPIAKISQFERDNCVKSISCVSMLILLAAQSLGLGSCYMTGPLLAEDEVLEFIKIKNGHSIGAIIPVGHRLQL